MFLPDTFGIEECGSISGFLKFRFGFYLVNQPGIRTPPVVGRPIKHVSLLSQDTPHLTEKSSLQDLCYRLPTN